MTHNQDLVQMDFIGNLKLNIINFFNILFLLNIIFNIKKS